MRFHSIGALAAVLSLSVLTPISVRAQVAKDAPKPAAPAAPVTAPALPPVPAWDTLKAAYEYETKPLEVKAEAKSDPTFFVERLTFTDAKGETVSGLFVRPKAEGVYPVALNLHGLGSNKEETTDFLGHALAEQGISTLALDAPLHGERKPKDQTTPPGGPAFARVVHDGVLDYRQIIGYLKTRKDVDSARLGLLGYSMGAMMGSILSGVDDRITATALCVGGDPIRPNVLTVPEGFRELVESISPSNYVGHISPRPVFLINGKEDQSVKEPAAKALQDAAREPKTILWVTSGHILPVEERKKAVDWLAQQLKK